MHPILYQLFHPWHWLTYGQNATAAGLVGLLFYTWYTRRMMKLAELSRRSTVIPVFAPNEKPTYHVTANSFSPASELGFTTPTPTEFGLALSLRNVGEGTAVFLTSWHQPVSEQFKVGGRSLALRGQAAKDGLQSVNVLLKGELTEIVFKGVTSVVQPWLFIVESSDLANGKNQLQLLMKPGFEQTQVQMVHALGDTLLERMAAVVRRMRIVG